MAIQFDERNLLADMVGRGNGITRAEIERSTAKALRALKSFRKLSDDGVYGFAHLPFRRPGSAPSANSPPRCEARSTPLRGRHRRQRAGRVGSRLRLPRPASSSGRLHAGASAAGDSRQRGPGFHATRPWPPWTRTRRWWWRSPRARNRPKPYHHFLLVREWLEQALDVGTGHMSWR